ncbi:hypothetical protein OG520_35945 [Streptomyces sp. NBC_00984]|nr:hypothetical protein OG520_35945 [Streptomyces sp. NBC_00984]
MFGLGGAHQARHRGPGQIRTRPHDQGAVAEALHGQPLLDDPQGMGGQRAGLGQRVSVLTGQGAEHDHVRHWHVVVFCEVFEPADRHIGVLGYRDLAPGQSEQITGAGAECVGGYGPGGQGADGGDRSAGGVGGAYVPAVSRRCHRDAQHGSAGGVELNLAPGEGQLYFLSGVARVQDAGVQGGVQ